MNAVQLQKSNQFENLAMNMFNMYFNKLYLNGWINVHIAAKPKLNYTFEKKEKGTAVYNLNMHIKILVNDHESIDIVILK